MPQAIQTRELDHAVIEDFQVRAIDEENRTITFVAATENPIRSYYGAEVLRLRGLDLKRYRKNPIVLDTHDRFSVESIVGSAKVSRDADNRELLAEIRFAETPRAEIAWSLAKGKFLRALSVGFRVDRSAVKQLGEGETDGSGEAEVQGPAVILNRSELLEISVVPVPADPDAIARGMDSRWGKLKERKEDMSKPNENANVDPKPADKPKPEATPSDPAPAVVREVPAPTEAELFRRNVEALAPRGMADADVDAVILKAGADLDKARKLLLECHQATHMPVGTPEPAAPVKTEGDAGADAGGPAPTKTEGVRGLKDVSDEDLVASLTSPAN